MDLFDAKQAAQLDVIARVDPLQGPLVVETIKNSVKMKTPEYEELDKRWRAVRTLKKQLDELPAYKGVTKEEEAQVDELLELA